MTTEEFKKTTALMTTLFKNFEIKDKFQFDVWYSLVEDIPFQDMQIIIKKLATELTFPPTIADIRKAYRDIKKPKTITSAEAWGEVKKAMSNYGQYDIKGALDSMSERTREVVKMMGFRELCLSENEMVDRSHFLKMYGVVEERISKQELLPESVGEDIKQIQNKVKMLANKMSEN